MLGGRLGSDPVLLWLWHRLAAAAQIGPLAWELPYASGTKVCTADLAQEVKDPRFRRCSVSHNWGSDLFPGHSICYVTLRPGKKKKKKKLKSVFKKLTFWNSSVAQRVEETALSLQQLGLLLWLGFNSRPRNLHMPWTRPKKKKR